MSSPKSPKDSSRDRSVSINTHSERAESDDPMSKPNELYGSIQSPDNGEGSRDTFKLRKNKKMTEIDVSEDSFI